MSQLLDGDALLAFVRTARAGAKSAVVQSVYDGIEQRTQRGDFNLHEPHLLDTDDPELLRERGDDLAWLTGQAAIDGGGETPLTASTTRTAPSVAGTTTRGLDNHLTRRRSS